jgi:hypothetical protein
MLSVTYCDKLAWISFTKLYSRLQFNTSVVVIIRLMLSVFLNNTVITFSGFHCNKIVSGSGGRWSYVKLVVKLINTIEVFFLNKSCISCKCRVSECHYYVVNAFQLE